MKEEKTYQFIETIWRDGSYEAVGDPLTRHVVKDLSVSFLYDNYASSRVARTRFMAQYKEVEGGFK
jgi:hypothetical protein